MFVVRHERKSQSEMLKDRATLHLCWKTATQGGLHGRSR
jgi:hypothetical protein